MILYFASLALFFIKPLTPIAAIGGYALLWKSLQEVTRPVMHAFLWFAAIHAAHLTWLLTFDYHGLYIVLVYILLVVLLSLPFAIVPISSKESWVLTCYFVTLEYVIQHFVLCGFTMEQVGLMLTHNLYSAQLASVLGVLGLTMYVMWTNFMLLRARFFIIPVALALFPYLFGIGHFAWHSSRVDQAAKIRVGLVQTGLRSEEKRPLGSLDVFMSPYEQWYRIISYLAKETSYDLIVLPEVAVPFEARRKIYEKEIIEHIFSKVVGKVPCFKERLLSNLEIAEAVAHLFQAELVIGLIDGQTNSAFFIKGNSVERYVKQILMPMAESLPFESLRALSRHYGVGGFLTAGQESVVFSSDFGITPSICYEEMLSHVIRAGRIKGGKLLVNMTNDVWFPSSTLPVKHFMTSKIRTLENGIPLVRSCNTGITAAVDSLGRLLGAFHKEGDYEWGQGALVIEVPLYHYRTLYSFLGDTFLLVLSGFSLMFYPLRKIISKHMLNGNIKIAKRCYDRSA